MNTQKLALADFNLNLLVTFLVMYSECNVSKSAQRLGLGQPAVSGALVRLRKHFNDPLFIRVGKRMHPTAKALALAEVLTPAMNCIENAICEENDQLCPKAGED
jgi:LysR family transcriptional activator of mexEF-oprN operon